MKRHLILLLALACGAVAAQENPPVRVRGVVASFDAPILVVTQRSGNTLTLTLPDETGLIEVMPTDITTIQPGSFIGTAAMPRADGKLEALEVVVFPQAARGAGEGHYPWDLKPQSTMTNATVVELARTPHGRTLTLRYKGGEKMVIVPDGVPVVTLRPGDHSLIVPGAKVFIVAEPIDDQLTVRRLMIGRNGFQPPM